MEFCSQHAPDGMVDVKSRKCRTEGCGKIPSFGVAGTKTVEYCLQHATDGMVDVKRRKCRTEGCGKRPSFGVAGTKIAEYCAQHASDGMVNLKSRKKCGAEGCGEESSFGVANTTTVKYCVQHVSPKYGVEEYKERKAVLHHTRKETIDNVVPSDGNKHETVHSPPAQGSPSSGGSRGFRKRVRHPEITSTSSTRAGARESIGEAVTVPDTDGRNSPAKRDFSVKIDVQLSL